MLCVFVQKRFCFFLKMVHFLARALCVICLHGWLLLSHNFYVNVYVLFFLFYSFSTLSSCCSLRTVVLVVTSWDVVKMSVMMKGTRIFVFIFWNRDDDDEKVILLRAAASVGVEGS